MNAKLKTELKISVFMQKRISVNRALVFGLNVANCAELDEVLKYKMLKKGLYQNT